MKVMLKSVRKCKQSQRISYALMLFFMLSQTVAADSACKMDMSDHDMTSSQAVDANNSHAGHDMQNMDHTMQSSMAVDSNSHAEMSDCCDQDCQCTQKSCNSSNAMITYVTYPDFNSTQHATFLNQNQAINTQASSALYRPPIFC